MPITFKEPPPSKGRAKGGSFTCPNCGGAQTNVLDSRPSASGVRRRRCCAECDCRFTTTESLKEQLPVELDAIRQTIELLKAQVLLMEKALSALE